MKNLEIAKIFYEIADILEFQGVEFKPRAYRRAAQTIESLSEDIKDVYEKGKLMELPGVGENISKKIEEIIKTGKLKYYEDLKKSIPVAIEELLSVPGIGPKTAKKLYDNLHIKTLADLKKALEQHKISKIEGLREKTEEKISKGIQFAEKIEKRMLLGYALPLANSIVNKLKKLPDVKSISLAGSLRRKKETIGDIDILVISKNPLKVMDAFTGMEEVKDIIAKGETKSSVRLDSGIEADLRVVEEKSFGSALQYFTGSKLHNIKIRKIAIKKKLKLNEYGIFKGNKFIAGKTEEEVYKKLGLPYIEPELREDTGEIEAAMKNKLPVLIKYSDIKGDLHVHTEWSDGAYSIEEMAGFGKKLGYEYVLISDHSGFLKIARGLSDNNILKQNKKIKELNKKSGIKILSGTESNIKKDGTIDVSNKVLKQLDIAIAGIHSSFNMPEKEMTKRIIKAMENENIDIISHPTGRLINKRGEYSVNLPELFESSKKTNTLLELNAFPERLDLKDIDLKAGKGYGLKFSIGTDAHSIEHLHFMELGVETARRGWLEKKDVVNTLPLDKLMKCFKK